MRKAANWLNFPPTVKLKKGTLPVDLAHQLIVLGRDGWIHSVDPRSPDSHLQRIGKEPFQAASAAEMRNLLRNEFGSAFQIYQRRDRIAEFERIIGNDTLEFSQKAVRYLEAL
jgi:hypothetical protein